MIDHVTRLKMGCEGVVIYVFGDRQQGSVGYVREAWEEFRYQFKREKNAWGLGVGDYGDFLRPSMRAPLCAALAKDDSARKQLENHVLKGHDDIIDEMDFLKGRLIGLHEGHHNWNFMTGGSTDLRLATALEAPFLGWTASTRLILDYVGQKSHVYTMISTHGNANGRRVGAAINWMEQNIVAGFYADQYIMGHGCKNATFEPMERNVVRRTGPPGCDRQIPRCLVVGGFARCYTNGWDSDWGERSGFSPQPLGWGKITFKMVRRRADQAAKGISAHISPKSRGSYTLHVEQTNINPPIP